MSLNIFPVKEVSSAMLEIGNLAVPNTWEEDGSGRESIRRENQAG